MPELIKPRKRQPTSLPKKTITIGKIKGELVTEASKTFLRLDSQIMIPLERKGDSWKIRK